MKSLDRYTYFNVDL